MVAKLVDIKNQIQLKERSEKCNTYEEDLKYLDVIKLEEFINIMEL